ncbi:hypothetical protein TSMEX_005859, partial [Taenia solium]
LQRLTGRLPAECIPECKAGHSAGLLTVITRSVTCHSPVNFPTNSSMTPRSAISAAVAPCKFSGTTSSVNESWSLKRIPPTATNRFDSTGSTTISSTMSTSSTLGHREQRSGPLHLMYSHLIDQKSEVVNRVYPPSRVSASRNVYDMGNWLSESQTNYRQMQSRQGTIVLPEACRQSSEPPMVPKAGSREAEKVSRIHLIGFFKRYSRQSRNELIQMVRESGFPSAATNLAPNATQRKLVNTYLPVIDTPVHESDNLLERCIKKAQTADYSKGVYYNPYHRQHNHHNYQQQQQEQHQYHHHHCRQQDQQKHQRLRQHLHSYEMGDEEAVERLHVELKARLTPQWSISVSPQSLLRREKTPGPHQAAFSISPRNPHDYSLGARQSCPPYTHSRSAYLDYEEEHTKTRNYVSAKRTVFYRAGDRPAVY